MYENYVPWESGVPADLHPAVKHLRESFDEAEFHFGWVTSNLCYSQLHPAETMPEDDVRKYTKAFVQLDARIGPAASQRFKETFAQQTPSAIFKSFFDFYLEGLSVQVLFIFKALAEIGRANESRLDAPHLEWAESQTKHLIDSNIHLIDIWVTSVCDKDLYDAIEDLNERTQRTKWQAPLFLIMKPSLNQPYDAARAWERTDPETSMEWRKVFYEHYQIHLKAELRRAAGNATVELAKQPNSTQSGSGSGEARELAPPESSKVNGDEAAAAKKLAKALQDPKMHPTLSVKEVMLAFSKSKSSIYRWIDEGKLKQTKVPGRILTTSVKALLESRKSSEILTSL